MKTLNLSIWLFLVTILTLATGVKGEECTISGNTSVRFFYGNSNVPDDPDVVYTLENNNSFAEIFRQEGGLPAQLYLRSNMEMPGDRISLPNWGLVFGKVGGSLGGTQFNWAQFTDLRHGRGTVCGTLVDSTGSGGDVDSMQLFAYYQGAPAVIMDHDLTVGYVQDRGGDWYLRLGQMFSYGGGSVDLGGTWFVPVNAATQSMYIDCDDPAGGPDIRYLEAPRTATTDTAGPCDIQADAIPTLTKLGYALLAIALFALGIGTMRRRGMGKDMAI